MAENHMDKMVNNRNVDIKGSEIPAKIRIHLDEIAQKLWMRPSHACALVGAGFSINALKSDESIPTSPTWAQLADKMLERLCEEGTPYDKQYLDVLNVADELQAAKGIGEMNRFLEANIPNDGLAPSELHRKFMSLPWTDVLTTNYDTLLERAADSIVDRNYERVVSKDKLVLSHSPRIIKLHGSFPSNPPYVISGEDYRRYPTDNAIFVNTVQQALIENTLCLFGFSGDDPNFIKWIGWIRDNLGENMPRIYLIGYLNCPDSKMSLLDKRRIVPVDIAPMCKSKDDIYDALMAIVNYLLQKHVKPEDWGRKGIRIGGYHDKTIKTEELVEVLYTQRKMYPGWKVTPKTIRQRVLDQLYYFPQQIWANTRSPYDIRLLYEYDFLVKKAYLPLDAEDVELYEKIINRYDPFGLASKKNESKDVLTKDNQPEWNWKEIGSEWLELQLSLLRAYRMQGRREEWLRVGELLTGQIRLLNNELKSKFYYEQCLKDIYWFELGDLEKHIGAWGQEPMAPLWKAKRAALIAEFFDVDEAMYILVEALREERNTQNLQPVENDYSFVSVESVILCLLERVRFSQAVSKWKEPSRGEYSERMRKLCMYDCNPMGELAHFEDSIRPLSRLSNEEIKPSFDIGRITTTMHIGGEVREFHLALQYVCMLEDMGYPFHLPQVSTLNKEPMQIALSIIAEPFSWMANAILFRLGEKDCAESIITRKYLIKKSHVEVDELLKQYLGVVGNLLNSRKPIGNLSSAFISILPEMMSRLVTKASFELRKELLMIVGRIYSQPMDLRLIGLNTLMKRLMESFSIEQQSEMIEQLFSMPFPQFNSMPHELFRQDAFNYLSEDVNGENIHLDNQQVISVINKLGGSETERIVAFGRLRYVHKLGLLTADQQKLFAEYLWAKTNADGFPEGLSFYYYFVFTRVPHPETIDPCALLRSYFTKKNQMAENNQKSVIYPNKNGKWHNILGVDGRQYKWTENEIQNVIDDILNWWEKNKHYMYRNDIPKFFGNSPREETEETLRLVTRVLYNVINPHLRFFTDTQKKRMTDMVAEITPLTSVSLPLRAVWSHKRVELLKDVEENLYSNSEENVVNACQALNYLWRESHAMSSVLNTVVNAFSLNKRNGKRHMLDIILFLLRDGWKPTQYQKEQLSIGLRVHYEELCADIEDTVLAVEDKLLYRMKCIEIAGELYRILGSDSVNDNITDWLKVTQNPDEFWEIRNVLSNLEIGYK